MEMVNTVFYIAMVIWYISYIIFIIYLYFNDSKPYDFEYDVTVDNIDRTAEDLSLIIYRKIKVETLTANIIKLINNKIITVKKEDDDFIFINNNVQNLSKSQENLMEFLFDTIGSNNKVSLDKINNFCNRQSNCSSFLLQYNIWKKIIIVESHKKDLFEPKLEYNKVKLFQKTGILLFLLNIALTVTLKNYSLLGFFLIVPSIFISLYFYRISKLTKECTQEYYGWLKFRKAIFENKIVLNKNKYLEYAVILKCIDKIEPIERCEFVRKLDVAIRKCYTKATLNGNRSIFKR